MLSLPARSWDGDGTLWGSLHWLLFASSWGDKNIAQCEGQAILVGPSQTFGKADGIRACRLVSLT